MLRQYVDQYLNWELHKKLAEEGKVFFDNSGEKKECFKFYKEEPYVALTFFPVRIDINSSVAKKCTCEDGGIYIYVRWGDDTPVVSEMYIAKNRQEAIDKTDEGYYLFVLHADAMRMFPYKKLTINDKMDNVVSWGYIHTPVNEDRDYHASGEFRKTENESGKLFVRLFRNGKNIIDKDGGRLVLAPVVEGSMSGGLVQLSATRYINVSAPLGVKASIHNCQRLPGYDYED